MTVSIPLELALDAAIEIEDFSQRRARLRAAALRGTPEDRVLFLQTEVFVWTPDVQYMIETIEALLERSLTLASPAGIRIVAPGGMGKDAILRYFIRKYPPQETSRSYTCPIVYADLRSRVSPIDLLQQFLDQLKCAYKRSWGVSELEEHLFEAMNVCKTIGIFINEAGHLISVGQRVRHVARLAGTAGDWFKGFIDRNKRPFVLLGVTGWDGAFEKDSQLRTRIPHRYEFREFKFDVVFIGVLQALDQGIPMPQPAGLDRMPLAQQLHIASQGNWRLLTGLLVDAVLTASTRGAQKIEVQDLYAAYRFRFGPHSNPFPVPT